MVSPAQEKFEHYYQQGQDLFTQGKYGPSIHHLERAQTFVNPQSREGGELQVWLMTAYQAVGKTETAIALGEQLQSHPSYTIREQAKRMVYILRAPELQRPKEWISEIPSFQENSDRPPQKYQPKAAPPKPKPPAEPLNPAEVERENDQFLVFALGLLVILCGSLWWFARLP